MRRGLVCAVAVLTIAAPGAGPTLAAARDDTTPVAVSLSAPAHARYGKRVVFRGTVTGTLPADALVTLLRDGSPLAQGIVDPATGGFAIPIGLGAPGSFEAQIGDALSPPVTVRLRPRLRASLRRSVAVGGRLLLAAQVVPAGAGALSVRVLRNGRRTFARSYHGRARILLGTGEAGSVRVTVRLVPRAGWLAARRLLRTRIVQPQLAVGVASRSVLQLRQQLRRLGYAVPAGSGFDGALVDSVVAFQKVQGLPRTGSVDRRVWSALAHPRLARPRYATPAEHLEVDKGHQVLLVVRHGRVALIIPVSTAGLPGRFTPVGRFAIYRKVGGFDPSPLGTLFDPMYFTGGYAIHGNPSVPPFPASHGCVRVPMWIAGYLYATNGYGETVYVY